MEPMDCLVIYVPTEAAEALRQAIGDAALSVHPYETPAFMTFPVDAGLPDRTGPAD